MRSLEDLAYYSASNLRKTTAENIRRHVDDRVYSMVVCTLVSAERHAQSSSLPYYVTQFGSVQCGADCTIGEANEALDAIRAKGFKTLPGPVRGQYSASNFFDIDDTGRVVENGVKSASALNIIVSWELDAVTLADVVNKDSTPPKESNADHLRDHEPESQPNPIQRSGTGWLLALLPWRRVH
jgi:hypothetical protein